MSLFKHALRTFFGFGGDGAAEEEHIGVMSVVIHLIGDEAFAKFLREQPSEFRKAPDYRVGARNCLSLRHRRIFSAALSQVGETSFSGRMSSLS